MKIHLGLSISVVECDDSSVKVSWNQVEDYDENPIELFEKQTVESDINANDIFEELIHDQNQDISSNKNRIVSTKGQDNL